MYLGLQWKESNLPAHKALSISHQSTVKFWFSVNCVAFCSTTDQRSWKMSISRLWIHRSAFRATWISKTMKINSNANMIPTEWPVWKRMAMRGAWLPIWYIVVWILYQIWHLTHQLSSETDWGTQALLERKRKRKQAFIN